MPQLYARGKRAWGLCDRCSQRYDLSDLQFQIVNQKPTGIKVCPECNDIDQEQLQLGRFPINDPVALLNPRPDFAPGRSLFGWAPVSNNAIFMTGGAGVAFVD